MDHRKLASEIRLLERDCFLKLDVPRWPPKDLELLSKQKVEHRSEAKADHKWEANPWFLSDAGTPPCRYLERILSKENDAVTLHETILRFPSAPLFGPQRKRDYQFRLPPIHQHTFRLLTSLPPGSTKIEHIFLFFNGLNEIEHLGFYYELARLLIAPNGCPLPGVACLIHPFPAHLTRYPLVGRFAERPLQRFITDPSDLFRQYLRFMVEMQWLLSTLVPVSFYPVTPGIALLAEDEKNPLGGRCDSSTLGKEIFSSWKAIYKSSREIVHESQEDEGLKKVRERSGPITAKMIVDSVETLRRAIAWEAFPKPLGDLRSREEEPSPPSPASMPPPRIHVVGYSLGGYLAQCAFFTWPFAIGSCTTLCSGGSLQGLRPVKIVHEEEWRVITHGLQYEIDAAMLENRLRIDPGSKKGTLESVCGIRSLHFGSHFQIFNDVFLQHPNGSYRPRVSEFVSRLLFVVGGNDPIVSTKAVLEASPEAGINMIEVANLSHFIAMEKGEWSGFWLPTVGKVISSFAEHSEQQLANSMLSNLWSVGGGGGIPGSRMRGPMYAARPQPGPDRRDPEPLTSELMMKALGAFGGPLENGAFLLILRNQIPFIFMGPRMLYQRGAIPHYEDFQIRNFWEQMQNLEQVLKSHADRLALVLPSRLNNWLIRSPSILSAKNLLMIRDLDQVDRLRHIWMDFLAEWEPKRALYRFDPENPKTVRGTDFQLETQIRQDTATPPGHPILNCLPDLWIGLSAEVINDIVGGSSHRITILTGLREHALKVYTERNDPAKGRTAAIVKTKRWLATGDLRIIRISAAQSPRFLGERIWDERSAEELLIHGALALARSIPCCAAGDFAKALP